ncbi:MAG: anthranilate phosphoribosyltransferase [Gammaproteobacteria bacterium]|nr:anthranilate phosphoribosyltransferase [Gammaproteobacteria bacterium]
MLRIFNQKLLRQENLTTEDIQSVVEHMIAGENEAQIAACLALLRAKGETVDEIYDFVTVMRSMMHTVKTPYPVLDIVGTGGDGLNTLNISTASALLAASMGVNIAKHGNRAVSSQTGSADILEALGVDINQSPEVILSSIESNHFGFFYAPHFHPALAKLKLIRSNLRLPTVFNLIGPLLNPARASYLMVGVADPAYLEIYADVLLKLHIKRALVFHTAGLDELCCAGPIQVIEIKQQHQIKSLIMPEEYGFKRCSIKALQGASPKVNAERIQVALQGETGPVADTFILNAGLAHYLCGLSRTRAEGILKAKDAHGKGLAYQLLQQLREVSDA